MKNVIACYRCSKLIRFSESYQIKLSVYKEVNPGTFELLQSKVRFCRACTKKVGYKVKTKQPKLIKKV